MKCQKCKTQFQPGQKFCGDCGNQLEKECQQCGAVNPPLHSFCGQCGHDLVEAGSCIINRTGLIIETNSIFLNLLGRERDTVINKPFSLFVAKQDLAAFFSHLNDLISSSQRQRLEIELKNRDDIPIYAQVEYAFDDSSADRHERIKMTFIDVSDRRLAREQIQYKDNLISLIFTITKDLLTVSPIYRDKSIKETLKTVCLFTKAHSCFFYHINEGKKRLDTVCRWTLPNIKSADKNISFTLISKTLTKIRRERSYIVNDVTKLTPARRSELTTWLDSDLSAVMCHLVFNHERPVGIIGVSRADAAVDWQKDTIALVNLVGHLINHALSSATYPGATLKKSSGASIDNDHAEQLESGNIDAPKLEIIIESEETADKLSAQQDENTNNNSSRSTAVAAAKQMRFEKDYPADDKIIERVYPREDGMVQLTCSNCGFRELVPPDPFDNIGYTLLVTCACQNKFSIMRELRWFYRKKLRLDGFYKLTEQQQRSLKYASKRWAPMVVSDLSKSGLRFSSLGILPYQAGEQLLVKFNLDNSSQTLIKKLVTVRSVVDKNVGCQFEGTDQYDTALGFYLL